jgi:hypothetical protein
VTNGSQEPHQQDIGHSQSEDATVQDGDHDRGDMGGDTGPTQPSTRGGSGLSPAEVRAADERAADAT